MAHVGHTNLYNTEANKSYYEAEVDAAAKAVARSKVEAYYHSPIPARWIALTSKLVEDGAEILPGEITKAFEGHSPKVFIARDKRGGEIKTTKIATNVDDPERKAATDFTASHCKSYTTLIRCAELAGERDLALALRKAKENAIREVFAHAVDLGLIRTRRGQGGHESEVPQDIMIAIVPHDRSRSADPQEHDHILVFNGGLRADGTVGTLDLSQLVTHKFYIQALIGASLGKKIQEMGFALEETSRGQWEIAGRPKDLIDKWSQGRKDVLKALTGVAAQDSEFERPLGRNATQARREAKDAAAKVSRRHKSKMEDERVLQARHRDQIASCKDSHGVSLTPDGVVTAMRAAAPLAPVLQGQAANVGIEALFSRTSVATMRQFRTAVAEAAVARGLSVAEIEAEVQRVLASGAVKAIGATQSGEAVLSTDAAMEMEFRTLIAAREGIGQGRLTHNQADRAMATIEVSERAAGKKSFSYTDEQREFVQHFAGGDQFTVGQGLAGTGKTTAMAGVVRMAKDAGMRTVGVAPTNSAAETIKLETRADEHCSLQKLALELRTGQRTLTRSDYVLIDEAGMAELGDVAVVIQAARTSGAHVGLVGDERQFAPIGAGAPFAALATVLGSKKLTDIRRQRVSWQNAASRQMAAGNTDDGLMSYAAEGRWVFGLDRDGAMDKLQTDWTADLNRKAGQGGDPASRIVIAQRHEDAHAINARLRQVLIDRGELGNDEITVRTLHRDGRNGDVRDLSLRVGDQLVVWRRVPEHNLNNNDRIAVVGFQPVPGSKDGDIMLSWRTEKTGIVTTAPLSTLIPPKAPDDPASLPQVPFLQHAYAVTQFSSQGKTVDRSFVYGGTGLDARSVYVSMTRHRDDAHVYWDRDGIAQQLREEGQPATNANIVDYIRRESRRMTEKHNVMDFAEDVEAWLSTGDIRATRPMVSATAARMAAAERNAEATVANALKQGPQTAQAVRNADQATPVIPGPRRVARVRAEDRAAASYRREVHRQQEAAASDDRRRLHRLDLIVQALKRPGGAGELVSTLRDAPRRVRDDLAERAARAIPNIGQVLARWRQGWVARQRAEHLDDRREEINEAGRRFGGMTAIVHPVREIPQPPDQSVWTDTWLQRAQLGRYVPTARILAPLPAGHEAIKARLPSLPDRLTNRLSAEALKGLSRPSFGSSPASAPTVSVAAYAEMLTRKREALEHRVLAGVMRHTGKAESLARPQLEDALTRPDRIVNDELREGVKRLKALGDAERATTAALQGGHARPTAPIVALDPHQSPLGWRIEMRKAQRATQDHAPQSDPATDRAVFDSRSHVTVAEMVAMLRARRTALGMPSEVIAPPKSAAADIDDAIATLRDAVIDGRLSGRSQMAAVAPSDKQGWGIAYRNAAFDAARLAGASPTEARQHGLAADAIRSRQVSETRQRLTVQDVNRGEEQAVKAAIEAARAAEPARSRTTTQAPEVPKRTHDHGHGHGHGM